MRVFLSTDPLGYVDAFDRWLYVGGNPASYWDPFGLGAWSLAMGLAQELGSSPAYSSGSGAFPSAHEALSIGASVRDTGRLPTNAELAGMSMTDAEGAVYLTVTGLRAAEIAGTPIGADAIPGALASAIQGDIVGVALSVAPLPTPLVKSVLVQGIEFVYDKVGGRRGGAMHRAVAEYIGRNLGEGRRRESGFGRPEVLERVPGTDRTRYPDGVSIPGEGLSGPRNAHQVVRTRLLDDEFVDREGPAADDLLRCGFDCVWGWPYNVPNAGHGSTRRRRVDGRWVPDPVPPGGGADTPGLPSPTTGSAPNARPSMGDTFVPFAIPTSRGGASSNSNTPNKERAGAGAP